MTHIDRPTSGFARHPWLHRSKTSRVIAFGGGLHRLSQDLIVGPGDSLILAPGATLQLDKDVSIVSNGYVCVLGTRERPVIITATNRKEPWGVFSLHGGRSAGSRFSHCVFEYGGNAPSNLVAYTGMVNIHNSRARFDSCVIHENRVTDDALHAVYSVVDLYSCTFDSILSDAVDFDYSSGTISGCRFLASGGDALDLMTSTPRIEFCYISGAKDKGISIGEASNPVVFNDVIIRNSKGIAIKDASGPSILNSIIMRNDTGVHAYKKNEHYGGGGYGFVVNTILRDNGVDFEQDKKSDVSITNSNTTASHGGLNVDLIVAFDALAGRDFVLPDDPRLNVLRSGGSLQYLRRYVPFAASSAPIGLITPVVPEERLQHRGVP
jgi:parallel beta-helix repeat protein